MLGKSSAKIYRILKFITVQFWICRLMPLLVRRIAMVLWMAELICSTRIGLAGTFKKDCKNLL